MTKRKDKFYASALGVTLRAMRKSKKWSMPQLGNLIGVSPSAVQAWESNRTSPTWANIVSICQAYRISLSGLMLLVEKTISMMEEKNDPAIEPAAPGSDPKR